MTTPSVSPFAPASGPRSLAGMAVPAAILTSFLAASAAPTPLYRLYQESWAFSPVVLTAIFGVYAISLLAALLTVGSLSDHVGRRPVVLAALLLEAMAMALFLAADAPAWLLAARAVQGFATGAATSALGAALIDGHRQHGPIVNSVAPLLGMALGALGTSALAVYAPAPLHLVYGVLLGVFLLQALLIGRLPETVAPRPGAWASLRPRVRVPAAARRPMLRVSPVNLAVWALGGFFLSLVPSLVRAATGSTSAFVGGAVVATLTVSGAAAILGFRHRTAPALLRFGTATLALGVLGILAGVHLGQVPVLFVATVVAGSGFGAGFLGCVRTLMPAAAPDERAALLSAFYVQSYLAFSLPAMLAGLLSQAAGLIVTADLYAAALIALAMAGVWASRGAGACPQAGG